MKRAHEGKSQNPVFMKLLNEIKQEALANRDIMAYNVEKAMMTLQKCPNNLKTVEDCSNLKFFGKKTCELLEKKLEEYQQSNNGLPGDNDNLDEDENVGGKRAKKSVPDEVAKNKSYVPVKVDFNAYTILSIMYKNKQGSAYQGHMLKKAIMSEAEKYIDYQTKTNDNADADFPFEPAMSTLIAENYVIQKSPTSFCITDSGANIVASSLVFENPPNPLLVKWLTEMEEEAMAEKSEKQSTISQLLTIFQKCPIKLENAKDCMDFDSIFNYDDDMNLEWAKEILNELDSKLEQHKNGNNQQSNSDEEDAEEEQAKKTNKAPNQNGRKTKARGAKK